MERRATPLVFALLCAAFLTAVSSAPILPPFLARSSSHGGVSTAASAAQAKPLARKGKTVWKYVTKLGPTWLKGKVVGDIGASGKFVAKIVKYSATDYYIEDTYTVSNIKSGGKEPILSTAKNCAAPNPTAPLLWKNITSARSGRSFVHTWRFGPETLANQLVAAEGGYKLFGYYMVVRHANSINALCGKAKKVK